MDKLRETGDEIEVLTPHDLWPLPTYREMLFVKIESASRSDRSRPFELRSGAGPSRGPPSGCSFQPRSPTVNDETHGELDLRNTGRGSRRRDRVPRRVGPSYSRVD